MAFGYEIFGNMGILGDVLSVANVITGITFNAMGLVCYVLWGLGMYAIAQRRQVNHAWFAWVPVVRMWLLGCLSDQYQYVVLGRNKCRRKTLLTLSIVQIVLAVVEAGLLVAVIFLAVAEQIPTMFGLLAAMVILGAVFAVITVWMLVLKFMALYDLYTSVAPSNNTLFLVLSILFNVTEAFFIFFNRDSDAGMPPRRADPRFDPQNNPNGYM